MKSKTELLIENFVNQSEEHEEAWNQVLEEIEVEKEISEKKSAK